MNATNHHSVNAGTGTQDWSVLPSSLAASHTSSSEDKPLMPTNLDLDDSLATINGLLSELGLGPQLSHSQALIAWSMRSHGELVAKLRKADRDARVHAGAKSFFAKVRQLANKQGASGTGQTGAASNTAPNPHSDGNGGGQGGNDSKPDGFHVYRSKGALKVESDVTSRGEPTIAVDAARIKPQQGRGRQFDWAAKVRFQFTTDELPMLAAVVFNRLPRCEFNAHGAGNDKGLLVEHQNNAQPVVVRVWGGPNSLVVVPCDSAVLFRFQALVLSVLRRNYPDVDGAGLMAMIRVQGEFESRSGG